VRGGLDVADKQLHSVGSSAVGLSGYSLAGSAPSGFGSLSVSRPSSVSASSVTSSFISSPSGGSYGGKSSVGPSTSIGPSSGPPPRGGPPSSGGPSGGGSPGYGPSRGYSGITGAFFKLDPKEKKQRRVGKKKKLSRRYKYSPDLSGIISGQTIPKKGVPKTFSGFETRYPVSRTPTMDVPESFKRRSRRSKKKRTLGVDML